MVDIRVVVLGTKPTLSYEKTGALFRDALYIDPSHPMFTYPILPRNWHKIIKIYHKRSWKIVEILGHVLPWPEQT